MSNNTQDRIARVDNKTDKQQLGQNNGTARTKITGQNNRTDR